METYYILVAIIVFLYGLNTPLDAYASRRIDNFLWLLGLGVLGYCLYDTDYMSLSKLIGVSLLCLPTVGSIGYQIGLRLRNL